MKDGDEITFTLPFVPRGGFRSQQRQKYIHKAHKYIPNILEGSRIKTKVWYGIDIVYVTPTEFHGDLDNMLKSTLDSMNGYVIPDDSQVKHIDLKMAHDNKSPFQTRVTIRQLSHR